MESEIRAAKLDRIKKIERMLSGKQKKLDKVQKKRDELYGEIVQLSAEQKDIFAEFGKE